MKSERTAGRAVNAAGMTLLSVPANLTSGSGLLSAAAQDITRKLSGKYKPINYNNAAFTANTFSSAVRNTISSEIAEKSKVGAFLYQTGVSMLDSGAIALLSLAGVPNTTLLLGGAAGTQAMLDAKKRGATDSQAIAFGFASGFAEAIFEEVSLEKLLSPKRVTGKTFAEKAKKFLYNYVIAQGFTEGSEELATTWANTLSDALINGGYSELNNDIYEFMTLGYSENEAFKKAFTNVVKNATLDFAGGALSGLVMGAGAGALNSMLSNNAKVGKSLHDAYGTDVDALVLREASRMTQDQDTLQYLNDLTDEFVNRGKISDSQLGDAYFIYSGLMNRELRRLTLPTNRTGQNETRETPAEVPNEVQTELPDTAAENTSENTVESQSAAQDRAADPLTFVLNKATNGETISNADAKAILDNPQAIAQQQAAQEQQRMVNTPAEENVQQRAEERPSSGLTLPSVNGTVSENNRQEVNNGQGQQAAAAEGKLTFRQQANRLAGQDAGGSGRRSRLGRFLDNYRGVRNAREAAAAAARGVAEQQREIARIKDQVEAGGLTENLSGRDAGLADGSDRKTAILLNDSMLTAEQREAVRIKAAEGVALHFMSGMLEITKRGSNGSPVYARAFVSGDGKTMYVQADHHSLSWEQLLDHEELHREIKEDPGLRREIENSLLSDKRLAPHLSNIIDRYADAYSKMGVTNEDDVIEELLCDYRAGFDMLDVLGSKGYAKHAQTAKTTIRQAEQTRAAARTIEKSATGSESVGLEAGNLGTIPGTDIKYSREAFLEQINDLLDGRMTDSNRETPESLEEYETNSGKPAPKAINPDFATAKYSVEPPYRLGTKAADAFAEGLNEKARSVYDMFLDVRQASLDNTAVMTVGAGKKAHPKRVTIADRFLTAAEWNAQVAKDPEFAQAAENIFAVIPEDIRKNARLNDDGTISETDFEKRFKMARSLVQRLVDALPKGVVDSTVELDGKKVQVAKTRVTASVGGEDYRRALIAEKRRLYSEGILPTRAISTLSHDNWGAMGFLATNTKTIASGDFTTFCPQMYFNDGCWYCYRRAALTSGVNNKLTAETVWYAGEILQLRQSDIDRLNKVGGLRIQSFGDWMTQYSTMLADMLIDAEKVGLQIKIITKEPSMIDTVALLKEQGLGKSLYFNLSADYTIERRGEVDNTNTSDALPMNPERPFLKKESATGEEETWWKRALTVQEANEYRKLYPWVNTRIVATNVDEFIRGLKDPTVDVVTGYHGDIRQFERVSSENGETLLDVEPLGDAGMPVFSYNSKTGEWAIERDANGKLQDGKSRYQKQLAQRIQEEGLEREYYTKSCCIFGRCAKCQGKCGSYARSFSVKNATNRDQESVKYWQREMESGVDAPLLESQQEGKASIEPDWVPKLTEKEWDLAKRLMENNAGSDYNEGARYVLKSEKGKTVFVIYSTVDDGALLFANSGKPAILANTILNGWKEGANYGANGLAGSLDRGYERLGNALKRSSGYNAQPGNGGGAGGIGTVSNGQQGPKTSRRRGYIEGLRDSEYRALINTLKKLDGVDEYSTKAEGKLSTEISDEDIGTTLRTAKGSPIKRSSKYGVGKEIGGRVYIHKQYAEDVIPSGEYERAQQIVAEEYPDFTYNCVEYEPKTGTIRFDEAPGFDTEREPAVGDYVEVKADGSTRKGHTDYIWHHKWSWVKNDYQGFDVAESWNWSKQWLKAITGKTYEVNGKQYNDNGKSDGNGIGRWNAQLKAYGLPLDKAKSGETGSYSLEVVPEVTPTSNRWSRGLTEQQIRAMGMQLFGDVSQEEIDAMTPEEQAIYREGHNTQVKNTVSSYQKIYDRLKAEHPDTWKNLRVLDASSGLGYGTQAGRAMGFDVADIEPYPSEDRYVNGKPAYTDYSALAKSIREGEVAPYDVIISNAVLNVLPQDTVDNLTVAMGSLLKPGGEMYINVRDRGFLKDVLVSDKNRLLNYDGQLKINSTEKDGKVKRQAVIPEGLPAYDAYIAQTKTVQRGFTYDELAAYLEDALGPGYTVSRASFLGSAAAKVTKAEGNYSIEIDPEASSQYSTEAIAREVLKLINESKQQENREEGSYSREYSEAIDMLDQGELPRDTDTHIQVLDHTPNVYIDKAGAKDRRMVISWESAYLAMKKNGTQPGNYHNLGPDLMKQIPDKLADPEYVVTRPDGRINAILEMRKKGRPVLVSVEMEAFLTTTQESQKDDDTYNLIVTVMDASKNYLKNNVFANGKVVVNKNNEDPAHFISRLQLSQNATTPANALAESSENDHTTSEEKVKGEGKTSIETDSSYLRAVESGDMDAAQRMVDEAAKKAGYVTAAFHGTGEYFNEFRGGASIEIGADQFADDDIFAVQRIGRKNIRDLNSAELQSIAKFAQKAWGDMREKSPFFRAWFGDWRVKDQTPVSSATITKNAPYSAGKALNPDINRTISWGDTLKRETTAHLRSGGIADRIVGNIGGLVENAVLLDTETSTRSSKTKLPGTAFMHSFYVLAKDGNSTSLLKLFVEEAVGKTGNDFSRAYYLRDIKTVATSANGALSLPGGLTKANLATIKTVADLAAFVKKYDPKYTPKPSSVIVDDDGRPRIVYHQTAADIGGPGRKRDNPEQTPPAPFGGACHRTGDPAGVCRRGQAAWSQRRHTT